MKTIAGGQADGIARWAWQDPPARVSAAITQVRQLGQDADPAVQRELGDILTMLTRLAGSVGVQLAGQPGSVIELRFNPSEKRDTRGRWTRFGGVGQAADVMMKNREGFSVSVKSGGEPVSGYMVAQTDHTHTYPATILDDHYKLTRAIDDMLVNEKAAFRGKGDVYLGGWVHGGKLWLEPSDNLASRDEAVREGTGRNQIAVWDVGNGQEIQTGGSGGGRITEHANPQGAHWPYPLGLRGDGRGGPAGDSRGPGAGHPGTPQGIAAQLDLTGDGHGQHIPGTPYIYRHGWKKVSQFDTRRSEGIERMKIGKQVAGGYPATLPLDPPPALDLWPANLPAHQFQAVADYVSVRGSAALNGSLRRGEQPDPEREREIGAMDSLITSHVLKQDAVVYRGMAMTPKWRDKLRPGAVFSDLGYISTTTDPDRARKFAEWRSSSQEDAVPAIMEVRLPSGTNAAPGMPKLSEYVLMHGTRFRVDDVSPDGRNYKISVIP